MGRADALLHKTASQLMLLFLIETIVIALMERWSVTCSDKRMTAASSVLLILHSTLYISLPVVLCPSLLSSLLRPITSASCPRRIQPLFPPLFNLPNHFNPPLVHSPKASCCLAHIPHLHPMSLYTAPGKQAQQHRRRHVC